MDDAGPPPSPPRSPQRARGAVALSARLAGGRSRLHALRVEGSLRALFPRPAGAALEAVLLNTAGGLTGGDRMAVAATAAAGAHLVLSTQAAERAYRAAGGRAEAATRLSVAPGARLDWLPQETILFEGARLARTLSLDLRGDGAALLVEPVVLGRLARGESLRDARLHDAWEAWRDGRLVWADRLRLEGDVAALMDRPALGGGARALATVLYAAPDAEAHLARLRALPGGGASLLAPGVLVARLLAPDGLALRRALVPAILGLAGRLPRVWSL